MSNCSDFCSLYKKRARERDSITGTITITITQLRPKFCQNLTKYFSIHRAHLIGSTLSQAGSPALD
jgi:hypothetical protein